MDKPKTSQGNPLDKEKIYEILFVFMDNVLFQYKPLTNERGEDKITQDLTLFLNKEVQVNNTSFAFVNQYKERNSTADIGVCLISNHECFCWVETKRLPTPNGKDRDEREYVIVSQEKENGKKKFSGNGGIQRFKEGKHAPGLPYSIMIGYIQDNNNVDYWFFKINSWITELVNVDNSFWNNGDCLSKYVSNKCDRFLSIHKRKDETTITLHHYWIKL